LEVNVISPCKSANLSIGQLISFRTVDPQWGDCHNFSADFNPNNITSMQLQNSFQTTSRTHHASYATLKQNYEKVLVAIQICKIKKNQ
jgi:hypothetical protein